MDGDNDRLVAERAAEWLYRLETATRKEKAAFFRWLKESPHHVREVLIAAAWEASLRAVDPDHKIDIDPPAPKQSNVTYLYPKLANPNRRPPEPRSADPPKPPRDERQLATSNSAVPVRQPTPRPHRKPWYPPLVAFARVLVILLFALLLSAQPADHLIETGPSQWRTRTLNDGSVVQIGPRTQMIVEFDADHRLVHLKDGEAIFTVAKDAHRPFMVHTDMATARAVGTRFGVTRLKHQTEVVIAHGVVAVSSLDIPAQGKLPQSAQVSAGLKVIVDEAATLETRQVSVDDELAWAAGLIVFTRVPLAEAIEQFNRRNLMQIQIPPQAGAKRYWVTGKFRIADPGRFSKYVEGRIRADKRLSEVREDAEMDVEISDI